MGTSWISPSVQHAVHTLRLLAASSSPSSPPPTLPSTSPLQPVKILICDVDGCLFNITPAMLAKDLEETGSFFFNSKASIPDTLSPVVFRFLAEAESRYAYRIAIISGRDEGILPAAKMRIEAPQSMSMGGPEGAAKAGEGAVEDTRRSIRPFCYLFKPCGSHVATVDHKLNAVRGLLQCCAQEGITVETMGFIDDMPPHMDAFLEGAAPFAVPTFALHAVPRLPASLVNSTDSMKAIDSPKSPHALHPPHAPEAAIRLRPHNGDETDIVILALPPGSRKGEILRQVQRILDAAAVADDTAARSRLVEWESSGPDQWGSFVQDVVSTMATPGIRYALIKIVPDSEKVRLHCAIESLNRIKRRSGATNEINGWLVL